MCLHNWIFLLESGALVIIFAQMWFLFLFQNWHKFCCADCIGINECCSLNVAAWEGQGVECTPYKVARMMFIINKAFMFTDLFCQLLLAVVLFEGPARFTFNIIALRRMQRWKLMVKYNATTLEMIILQIQCKGPMWCNHCNARTWTKIQTEHISCHISDDTCSFHTA